ncbi:LPP20 family lipoprotein [Helicobacter ailurogastricus]|uniref:LPP20 family lipoprotein n=1 Tax=Helicobacter ailurogastricus TaxID=1578720 RepID=UPI000CF0E736|nr:LPP20 family lipoprotein [Helicobacter ailurogastricus]
MLLKKSWILLSLPLLLQAVPHWYEKTPDKPQFFYGSGAGDDKESAKEKALNDLASNISVHVSSLTTSTTTRNNSRLDKKASQNIKLVVDSIKFVHVETDKQECHRDKCYTRVRIDKNMFLNLLSKRYADLYNTLSPFKPAQGCHGIFIKEKQQIQSLLDKMTPLQEILSAYGRASAPLTSYKELIKANSPKPKAQIVFANGSDAEVVDALTGQYARFVDQTTAPGFYTINNKIFTSEGGGQFHIGLDINIKNCQGDIIYSKHLNADQSTRGDAIERIKAQAFKQMRNYQNGVGAGTADVNSDNIDF